MSLKVAMQTRTDPRHAETLGESQRQDEIQMGKTNIPTSTLEPYGDFLTFVIWNMRGNMQYAIYIHQAIE